MVDAQHEELSNVRQCELVSISRSAYYYQPPGETELNLRLMRVIDEQHLETPFYGARQMARHLRRQGHVVSRKRIRRLLAKMGFGGLLRRGAAAGVGDQEARCRQAMTAVAGKPSQARLAALGAPRGLSPMEAKLVTELPKEEGWQFEPKWDGFRCLAFRAGGAVEVKTKSGKSLSRFFPAVLSNLAALPEKNFVLDGELVIPVDGALSFDALQMRLHPRTAASSGWRRRPPRPASFLIACCANRGTRS